jgi:single-strand DNA-binding protein
MLNNVSIVGRITKDPEVRTIGSEGTAVCNFTVAVNRPFKDENGDIIADFIQCQAWKKQAEFMKKYIVKGQLIAITGSIHTRTYEKADQTTAYVTEINVDQIQSLERHEPQTEEQIKAQWTDEWNKRSVGLTNSSLASLKKDLTEKYQPKIDALKGATAQPEAKQPEKATQTELPF